MERLFRAAAVLVVSGLILSACATPPSPPSPEPARSIVLLHPESGEVVDATYWRGGRYDENALLNISLLFRDRRSGEVNPVDPKLVDLLWELRQSLGLNPAAPIHVLSGYRSPASNAILARTNRNVAENSYHMRAMAADIRIPGVPSAKVTEAARALSRGGYALYPGSQHIHVDTGPVRTWRPG